MAVSRSGGLAWMAVLFVAYLFVLQRLWFDAPISDDYYFLNDVMRLADAHSAREWLGIALAQHNEHRVAVVRIAAWAMATLFGSIDFRALALLGNLAVLGVGVLAWCEFRDTVSAPLFAAAALLLFQWTYYEASLMASAALANLGVVFFSFACVYFSTRRGWPAAAACVAFGILAVGSQANGLFALPIAAGACAYLGGRKRAGFLAAIAFVSWLLYFRGYVHPPQHPSVYAALASPLSAAQYFLIVVGGLVPGRWPSMLAGLATLAAIAWLARKRFWKTHLTGALWIVFLLASAGAATAGRIGLGISQAQSSRYAIYSTCLVVVTFLCVCAETRPWNRLATGFAVIGAAAASLAVSWMCWPNVLMFSLTGHMLFTSIPASRDLMVAPYLWTFHSEPEWSRQVLFSAQKRALYSPRKQTIQAPALRSIPAPPASARTAGHIDQVGVSGKRVTVDGWSDVPAIVPGRTLSIFPDDGNPSFVRFEVTGRPDVAMALRDAGLVSSGFRMELEYPSGEAAQRAASLLCILSEAPALPPAMLARGEGKCQPIVSKASGRSNAAGHAGKGVASGRSVFSRANP